MIPVIIVPEREIGRNNKTTKVRILNEWTGCYQTSVVTRKKGYGVDRERERFQAQNPYACRSVSYSSR